MRNFCVFSPATTAVKLKANPMKQRNKVKRIPESKSGDVGEKLQNTEVTKVQGAEHADTLKNAFVSGLLHRHESNLATRALFEGERGVVEHYHNLFGGGVEISSKALHKFCGKIKYQDIFDQITQYGL